MARRRARRHGRSAPDDGVAPAATIGHRPMHCAGPAPGTRWMCDVDADRFCSAVANADRAADKIGALSGRSPCGPGPSSRSSRGRSGRGRRPPDSPRSMPPPSTTIWTRLISARREADAVIVAEGQIELYPYRDRSRGLLIRALSLAGRQAEALRAFQTYRSLLVEEFGTEPSPEVVRIERRVATGWNGVDSDAGDVYGGRAHRHAPAAQPGSRGGVRRPRCRAGDTRDPAGTGARDRASGASSWAVRPGWARRRCSLSSPSRWPTRLRRPCSTAVATRQACRSNRSVRCSTRVSSTHPSTC